MAAQRGTDAWGSARLLALMNADIADGGRRHALPVRLLASITAIRGGDTDGNEPRRPTTWESYLDTQRRD